MNHQSSKTESITGEEAIARIGDILAKAILRRLEREQPEMVRTMETATPSAKETAA